MGAPPLTRLLARAPGKVNRCLFVARPRADGLHPLVSEVQPLSLADDVTLEPAAADEVVCPGLAGENLAARALAGFRAATGWDGEPVRLTISKRVPVAGGMGGGSADAAAALRLAAAASGLTVPPGLAMALGADVPVLLEPRRALMTGAGEHVAPLPEPPPFGVVLLPVDATLPTGDVYRTFDALGLGRDPGELAELEARVRAGTAPAVNDLEPAARRLCPEIESALAALASAGADAMVSGSGPTVFGVCEDLPAAEAAAAALRQYGHPRAVAAAPVGPDFAAVRPG